MAGDGSCRVTLDRNRCDPLEELLHGRGPVVGLGRNAGHDGGREIKPEQNADLGAMIAKLNAAKVMHS